MVPASSPVRRGGEYLGPPGSCPLSPAPARPARARPASTAEPYAWARDV